MRQANNDVVVEGILSEVDLRDGSFEKNGQMKESISGTVKVKVCGVQVGDEIKDVEVPIRVFATKLTNDGRPNPRYESARKVRDAMVSIAAAGGEEGADCIRMTKGRVVLNEYSKDDKDIAFTGVEGSFFAKIAKSDCHPKANFEVEMFIKSMDNEVNTNGEETGRMKIVGVIPGFNDTVQIVDFFAVTPDHINYVSNYWQVNDTVSASGVLNFSKEVIENKRQMAFGNAPSKFSTHTVSELVLNGGSEPFEGEFAFSRREIDTAIAARKEYYEARKARTITPSKGTRNLKDLGF